MYMHAATQYVACFGSPKQKLPGYAPDSDHNCQKYNRTITKLELAEILTTKIYI